MVWTFPKNVRNNNTQADFAMKDKKKEKERKPQKTLAELHKCKTGNQNTEYQTTCELIKALRILRSKDTVNQKRENVTDYKPV